MESYQTWFGEGPELSMLRILGLFDRPAEEKALAAILSPPAVPGLTESLTNLGPSEWHTIVAGLRRARLLAGKDPRNPGQLDTHPLIREYFGEQLRSQQAEAWKECNRRLYRYYLTVAPQLPDSFREMEPLFLAVICGCNAGLFRETLHDVYIARIQRGISQASHPKFPPNAFAANILGARGALLSVLVHFFEHERWDSPVAVGLERQSLTAEDQLFILMQAGLYLIATRGHSAPEARLCYERAESLCDSPSCTPALFSALIGQWRCSLFTDKLSAAMQIAKRAYSLAQEQNSSALMIEANRALAGTLYFLGDFETALQYAMRGAEIWRSGGVKCQVEEALGPAVICVIFKALSAWHFGAIVACQASMAEAISLTKELNDTHALASTLWFAAILGHLERNVSDVERLASDVIELSTRQNLSSWLPGAAVLRGWARAVSGNTAEGLSWIEDGIRDHRANGSLLGLPFFIALKAEALCLADRTCEALEAITEAERLAKRSEECWWSAELCRLRGVFLTRLGADEAEIEEAFCEAIRTAKEQKSTSLEKRAEASFREYRTRKGER
jgi:tetratricopeptide (TPR) repeat protein